MDISEAYIEMCLKATEIQAQHEEFEGIVVPIKNMYVRQAPGGDNIVPEGIEVWLPRQDQLQQIHTMAFDDIKIGGSNPFAVIGWIGTFRKGFDYYPFHFIKDIVDTWEKFWLVMVMYDKYDKIWDCKENVWRDRR